MRGMESPLLSDKLLALLATLTAALVVAAALYAAFRTPGNFGLTTTRGAGIRPVVS